MTSRPAISAVEPSSPVDGDDVVRAERADAVEHRDLAALAHRRDAPDEAVDDLLLAGLGDGEVDRRRAGLDAELGGVGDVAVHGRRLEERLGRDAAPVEARAAEAVLLDERDLQAGRRGVQRGGVSTRAATDHHEIELLGRRDHLIRAWAAWSPLPVALVGVPRTGPSHTVAAGRATACSGRGELPTHLLVAASEHQHARRARLVRQVERQRAGAHVDRAPAAGGGPVDARRARPVRAGGRARRGGSRRWRRRRRRRRARPARRPGRRPRGSPSTTTVRSPTVDLLADRRRPRRVRPARPAGAAARRRRRGSRRRRRRPAGGGCGSSRRGGRRGRAARQP